MKKSLSALRALVIGALLLFPLLVLAQAATGPIPDTPIYFVQGDTWTQGITWTNSDNTPVDLTGADVRMQLRRNYGGNDVIIQMSTPSDGITLDAPNGQINITATAAKTELLTVTTGRYDVRVKFPNGVVRTLQAGPFTVQPETTTWQ
jgi:hypothetical protein